MTYNGLPLYEVTAKDDFEMVCVSIVDDPAVESDFITFSKDKGKERKNIQNFRLEDGEERNILGVAIRADYPIYRYDEEEGDYYITFRRDAIKEIVKQYSKDGFFNQVSLQHNGKRVDGVVMVEMFIKDIEKGINPRGFERIEDGSLFVCYHVENAELWNEIKTSGELNGFSIEIFTSMTPTREEPPTLEELVETLLSDQKKKFSVTTDLNDALNNNKVVTLTTKDGLIENAQIYQLGKIHGKNVAIIYGKNVYGSGQWYVQPIKSISKVAASDGVFVSWNTARRGASWQGVENLIDTESLETIKSAVVPANEYERAIIEHKMVMITYRDASAENCIYSRQCGIFEYGFNYKGNEALRCYQYYGSTHTDPEGWKMFLIGRILSFQVLDFMKPIEEAPQGFRYSGEDRDGFDCVLRADYLN